MSGAAGREFLNLRPSSVEGLADACGRFRGFPFDLEGQSFDSARRTWTGNFIRGNDDPARVTTRGSWLFNVTDFPLFATTVTIHNVAEAEIQDRAQIGVYTFRRVHPTASGCRFEFRQDCDLYIAVDGPFLAEVCDVGEVNGLRGRITSVGFVDFGVAIGEP